MKKHMAIARILLVTATITLFGEVSESGPAFASELPSGTLRIMNFVDEPGERQTVTLPSRDIPVVDRADIIVVGGGVAGTAAALSAASRDLSVALIESRNYFGCEITAPAMPLATPYEAVSGFPLAESFFQHWGKGVQGRERLNSSHLKQVLHKAVAAERRIKPYLFTICSGVVMRGEQIVGVVIYNRSGRQIVLANVVVDATADARVSAAAGTDVVRPPHGNTAHRTLQFHCDVSLPPGALKVPSDLGLLNDQVQVHGNGSCVLEYAFAIRPDGSHPTWDQSRAQVDSWRIGRAIMKYVDESLEAVSSQRPAHRWFSFAPEVGLSRRPTVRCEETLPEDRLELRRLLTHEVYTPRGVDGLIATGRILSPSPTLDGLQALLCTGEHAGQIAAEMAESSDSPPKTTLETQTLAEPSRTLPVIEQVDVVVVGGGTSGAPAAIAAGRQGATVALVEMLPNLGGTASNRVNGYYWGVPWRSHLTQELDSHISLQQRRREKRRFDGESKKLALQKLALEAGVRIYYQAIGTDVVMEDGTVKGVVVEGAGAAGVILAHTTIDATGHGDIAAAAGAEIMIGRDSDGMMNEIDGRGMRDPTDAQDISRFLMGKPSSNVALNVRESRRVVGDYVLTFDDALHGRVFPDTVCYWRSNYDTHFPTSAGMSDMAQDWVGIMGLWRYPIVAAIPYRCLLPHGVERLLVVGKSYSIDHDANIGGRMQTDLQHLGEAAGVAAAMAARNRVTPRQLDVGSLQRELTRQGVLPTKPVAGLDSWPATEASLSEAVSNLEKGSEADVDPNSVREFGGPLREAPADGDSTPDAMRRLYLAGKTSIPRLRPLLQSEDADVRTDAAFVLGMLGDRAAIPELLRTLETRNCRINAFKLEGCSWRSSLLAYRSSAILLGRLKERQAVPELLELIDDPQTCCPYLASFVIVALGRIGDESAVDAIRPYLRLLEHRSPEERAEIEQMRQENETNSFEMLYGTPTHAAWALAQLGDQSGVPVLTEMLDSDLVLVRQLARRLLEEIAGPQPAEGSQP